MSKVHELWITRLFNEHLAGVAAPVVNAFGHRPSPDGPWTDWMVCELIVFVFMIIFFAFVRRSLSVDRPGKVQHTLEVIYEFLYAQAEESAPHVGHKYLPFFGTLFFFIVVMNLIGIIPGFDSPTMFPEVPAGLAVCTFFFYNAVGLGTNARNYIRGFIGPMLLMAPLMICIEILSHLARPLSLTIRLFANMFAGEQVYLTFIHLTDVVIPVIFIGLHFFVGLLQAYIFTLLAMIYVGQATTQEH
jgi:F-type H+-transporting ATPase subunit a